MPNDKIKLNVGSGDAVIPGHINIDRKTGGEAYPLAYADCSVDEVRACHVLEHFGLAEVQAVVCDWMRVLRPCGRLRIAVPDVDAIMEARRDGDTLWLNYLMGGQTTPDDFHYCAFTGPILHGVMRRAGAINIRPWCGDGLDTASHRVSLNLEGFKPLA